MGEPCPACSIDESVDVHSQSWWQVRESDEGLVVAPHVQPLIRFLNVFFVLFGVVSVIVCAAADWIALVMALGGLPVAYGIRWVFIGVLRDFESRGPLVQIEEGGRVDVPRQSFSCDVRDVREVQVVKGWIKYRRGDSTRAFQAFLVVEREGEPRECILVVSTLPKSLATEIADAMAGRLHCEVRHHSAT